jgi:hypothetical protein
MSHIDSPWSMPRTGKVYETISPATAPSTRGSARMVMSGGIGVAVRQSAPASWLPTSGSATAGTELLVPSKAHAPSGALLHGRVFKIPLKPRFCYSIFGSAVGCQSEHRSGPKHHPPSDVIRPPSEAALAFLRATAGRLKDTEISWARRVRYSSVVSFPFREKTCRTFMVWGTALTRCINDR